MGVARSRSTSAVAPLEQVCAAFNPSVLSVGYHRAAPGYRYLPGRKRFPQFYFWYVSAGSGSVRIDGRWTTIGKGDFLILSPARRYQEERSDSDDPSRIYFSYIDPFGRPSPRMVSALNHYLPIRLPCQAQARAESLFADLLETYTVGSRHREIRLKVLSLEIFDLIFTSLEAHATPMSPRHRDVVRRAQEFIERHLTERITPEDIAEQVGVSASHLFAVFRRYVGCSPIRYQTDLRLRSATRKLLEGQSVTATARATGFASLHYFSRLFRKRYGASPSRFIRSIGRK